MPRASSLLVSQLDLATGSVLDTEHDGLSPTKETEVSGGFIRGYSSRPASNGSPSGLSTPAPKATPSAVSSGFLRGRSDNDSEASLSDIVSSDSYPASYETSYLPDGFKPSLQATQQDTLDTQVTLALPARGDVDAQMTLPLPQLNESVVINPGDFSDSVHLDSDSSHSFIMNEGSGVAQSSGRSSKAKKRMTKKKSASGVVAVDTNANAQYANAQSAGRATSRSDSVRDHRDGFDEDIAEEDLRSDEEDESTGGEDGSEYCPSQGAGPSRANARSSKDLVKASKSKRMAGGTNAKASSKGKRRQSGSAKPLGKISPPETSTRKTSRPFTPQTIKEDFAVDSQFVIASNAQESTKSSHKRVAKKAFFEENQDSGSPNTTKASPPQVTEADSAKSSLNASRGTEQLVKNVRIKSESAPASNKDCKLSSASAGSTVWDIDSGNSPKRQRKDHNPSTKKPYHRKAKIVQRPIQHNSRPWLKNARHGPARACGDKTEGDQGDQKDDSGATKFEGVNSKADANSKKKRTLLMDGDEQDQPHREEPQPVEPQVEEIDFVVDDMAPPSGLDQPPEPLLKPDFVANQNVFAAVSAIAEPADKMSDRDNEHFGHSVKDQAEVSSVASRQCSTGKDVNSPKHADGARSTSGVTDENDSTMQNSDTNHNVGRNVPVSEVDLLVAQRNGQAAPIEGNAGVNDTPGQEKSKERPKKQELGEWGNDPVGSAREAEKVKPMTTLRYRATAEQPGKPLPVRHVSISKVGSPICARETVPGVIGFGRSADRSLETRANIAGDVDNRNQKLFSPAHEPARKVRELLDSKLRMDAAESASDDIGTRTSLNEVDTNLARRTTSRSFKALRHDPGAATVEETARRSMTELTAEVEEVMFKPKKSTEMLQAVEHSRTSRQPQVATEDGASDAAWFQDVPRPWVRRQSRAAEKSMHPEPHQVLKLPLPPFRSHVKETRAHRELPGVSEAPRSLQRQPQNGENYWERAVEEASTGLAETMHNITLTLLRQLNPKEEAVTSIVDEYRRNGEKLTSNLLSQHSREGQNGLESFQNNCRQLAGIYETAASATQSLGDSLSSNFNLVRRVTEKRQSGTAGFERSISELRSQLKKI